MNILYVDTSDLSIAGQIVNYSFSILVNGGTVPVNLPGAWTIEYIDACASTFLMDWAGGTYLHPLDVGMAYLAGSFFMDDVTFQLSGYPAPPNDPTKYLCGFLDYSLQGSYPWLTVGPAPSNLDMWEFQITGPQYDFNLIGSYAVPILVSL